MRNDLHVGPRTENWLSLEFPRAATQCALVLERNPEKAPYMISTRPSVIQGLRCTSRAPEVMDG
jgi:hypothetical protein